MQNFSTIGIAILTVLAMALFFRTATQALFHTPTGEVPEQASMSEVATGTPEGSLPGIVEEPRSPSRLPMRLIIPALAIDARVQHVGITAAGDMATPSNFQDVAWYRRGTLPGDIGSAVIAGHLNNGLGLAGVFQNLSHLGVGDDIFVALANGEELGFTVREVERYPHDRAPRDKIFTRNDGRWLALITCGGQWIRSEQTYAERLVVYAELR